MTTSSLKLIVVDDHLTPWTFDLGLTRPGMPLQFTAFPQGRYVLADGRQGHGPSSLLLKRVGQQLHVSGHGKADDPQLIIHDYYNHSPSALQGLDTDGQLHAYALPAEVSHEGSASEAVSCVLAPEVVNDMPARALEELRVASQAPSVTHRGIDPVAKAEAILAASEASEEVVLQEAAGTTPVASAPVTIASTTAPSHESQADVATTMAPALAVATAAPGAPSIDTMMDYSGQRKGALKDGDITDEARPVLSGHGPAWNLILIFDDGAVVGIVVADGEGNWQFSPSEPLADGPHSIRVGSMDPLGNSGGLSDPWAIVIDSQPLGVSRITAVLDAVGSMKGPVLDHGVTDDNKPKLVGTGKAGATVNVYDNGESMGSVVVDSTGHWTYEISQPRADGWHEFTTNQTDLVGNTSPVGDKWSITIDTAGAAPAITQVLDQIGVVTGAVLDGGVTDDARPLLSGTGKAGATVSIYEGDTLIGRTIVEDDGTWELPVSRTLSNGLHTLTVQQKDLAGNTQTGNSWSFTIDAASTAPAIKQVLDQVGAVTGAVDDGGTTDDTKPILSGTGKVGATVSVYDGATRVGSAIVDGSGNWTVHPSAPLSNGSHTLVVQQKDLAGNTQTGNSWSLNVVDTVATAPVITSVNDAVGSITGQVANNGVTDDTKPVIKGTGEKGATVTVYDNGEVLGTAIVQTDGTWSYNVTTALSEAKHDFTASQVSLAGNTSPVSTAWTVTVDLTALAPVITGVIDAVAGGIVGAIGKNGLTNDNRPLIKGTGEKGATVSVYDNGGYLGTATVLSDGTWSFQPGTALNEGSHVFTAKQVDLAGNTSELGASWTVTVDSVIAQPTITSFVDTVGKEQGIFGNGASTDDTKPRLMGKAEAGSVVVVKDGSIVLGSTKANASGDWQFTPQNDLVLGGHAFSVTATDAAGNSATSTAFNITVVAASTSGFESFDTDYKRQLAVGESFTYASGVKLTQITQGPISQKIAPTIGVTGLFLSCDSSYRFTMTSGPTNAISFTYLDFHGKVATDPNLIDFYDQNGVLFATQAIAPDSHLGGRYTFLAPAGRLITSFIIRMGYENTGGTAGDAGGNLFDLWWGDEAMKYATTPFSAPVMEPMSEPMIDVVPGLTVDHSDDPVSSAEHRPAMAEAPSASQPGDSAAPAADNAHAVSPDSAQVLPGVMQEGVAPAPSVQTIQVTAHVAADGTDGNDTMTVADVHTLEGEGTRIDGHGGIDTLALTGTHQVLDFSLVTGKVSGVEVIDLGKEGGNTLKLTAGDVLDLGGKDLFVADHATQMLVKGDATDTLELSHVLKDGTDVGPWAQGGTVAMDGVSYTVYHNALLNTDALVQQDVQVHLA